jgi:hypothetical protein
MEAHLPHPRGGEATTGDRRHHPLDVQWEVQAILLPTAGDLQQGLALGVVPALEP